MSKRTRYFLVGSVAFLVVGLSIGLVAFYNGSLQSLAGASSGPDELRYVPDNAAVVAYADVQQIMGSQFRQSIKQLEPSAGQVDSGQQKFRDETGIDIEHDITRVVAYMTTGENGRDGSGAVIARGKFDVNRIGLLVKQKGGTVGTYEKAPFMTFGNTSEPSDREGGALAFVGDGSVLVVGSPAAVRAAVDLGNGKAGKPITAAPAKDKNKMLSLIGDVSSRGNAWVVGRFDALSSRARLPEQVASQIPPISWFTAAGEINGGVNATVSVEAADAAAAENLRKVVDGLAGLAGLQARSANVPSQVQQILNSFKIYQKDNTVTLSFSLSNEMLTGLAEMAHKQPPRDRK